MWIEVGKACRYINLIAVVIVNEGLSYARYNGSGKEKGRGIEFNEWENEESKDKFSSRLVGETSARSTEALLPHYMC